MLRTYYLDKLPSASYDAYYAIDSAVRAYRSECMLYGLNVEQAREVVKAYTYDNPDVWHCALQFFEVATELRGSRVIFTYNDFDESKFRSKFSKITEYIDKRITSYSSEERIAKLIYDYLCENVEGDLEVINAYSRLDRSDNAATLEFTRKYGASFSAYGAIANGKAACMGIAAAYKLLLDTYRIEAACVAGEYEGYPHMLNVLEINSERVYVDVSRGLIEKALPMIRYDYYFVDEERIRKYFTPEEDFGCACKTMNYFFKNNLIFKDAVALRKYLSSFSYSNIKGDLRFFYKGSALDDEGLEKIIDEVVASRCGTEYKIVGYVAEHGIGNCKMNKLEA